MKKSDYTRSTIECKYNEFKSAFIDDLRTYIERHKLGEIQNEVLHCFETTNHKKGFLGKIKTNYTEICMTTRFLFWGIANDNKGSGIGAAQWNEIAEIQDWESSEPGKIIEDHGVELFGFIYQASERSRWFIGLGDDEPGKKCRKIIKEFIVSSKK